MLDINWYCVALVTPPVLSSLMAPFILIRILRVSKFRTNISNRCVDLASRNPNPSDPLAPWNKFYYPLPSYNDMVWKYSFRPLKLEYWFTEEEIDELLAKENVINVN